MEPQKGGRGLKGADQLLGLVGNKQAGHILDADGVGAHVLDIFCNVHPVLLVISGTDGIGQSDLGVAALFLAGLDGSLKVAKVVEAVKDTDDVDAVGNGFLYEIFDDIISVVAVSQQVLAAEQHLQFGLLEAGFQLAKAVPRIFLEEAEAGIKCSAAPALNSVVADLIHLVDDGKHDLGGHAGRDQGLVRVAQDGLCDLDRLGCNHCIFRHISFLLTCI